MTSTTPAMDNQSPRNDSEIIVDYEDDYLSWTDNQISQQPTTTMPEQQPTTTMPTTTARTSLLLKCE